MVITAPLVIAGVAAAACGLGVCAVAHRLTKHSDKADMRCGKPGAEGTLWARFAPILLSAAACGLGMFVILYFMPSS